MLLINDEKNGLLDFARMICAAARTAPKGRGLDLMTIAIVDGDEKDSLVERMHLIAERDGVAFFARDAENVRQAQLIILFATSKKPLGLPHCGFCGFSNCGELQKAGAVCAFNSGDLGIALGSAVSRAADLRIDNRILYTAGKAALELGMLGEDAALAFGLPLSITGKSPFFDRK